MKYDVTYNRARNLWMVWRVWNNGNAEVVKTFKTETGARKWIAAKGA